MSFNVRLFGYSGIIQVGQSHAQQYSGDAVFLNEEPCLWSQILVCDGSTVATSTRITTVPDGTQMVCVEVPDNHEIRYEVVQSGAAARAVSDNSRRGSGSFNLAWSPGYTLSILDAVPVPVVVPITGACSAATSFFARTSGLDAAHIAAYNDLICGLVSDGVWSLLDILYVYATQDSTTALLNLKSASFGGTSHGAPTFTADRGFSGTNGSATKYIATGFNPTTQAPTSQLQQNAGHISMWNLTNASNTNPAFGAYDTGVDTHYYMFPQYVDGNAYYRLNANGAGAPLVANPTPLGHYITTRSGITIGCYRNGVNSGDQLETSQPVIDLEFYAVAANGNGSPVGSALSVAALTVGGLLDATKSLALYTRLRTYMTTVGVP